MGSRFQRFDRGSHAQTAKRILDEAGIESAIWPDPQWLPIQTEIAGRDAIHSDYTRLMVQTLTKLSKHFAASDLTNRSIDRTASRRRHGGEAGRTPVRVHPGLRQASHVSANCGTTAPSCRRYSADLGEAAEALGTINRDQAGHDGSENWIGTGT